MLIERLITHFRAKIQTPSSRIMHHIHWSGMLVVEFSSQYSHFVVSYNISAAVVFHSRGAFVPRVASFRNAMETVGEAVVFKQLSAADQFNYFTWNLSHGQIEASLIISRPSERITLVTKCEASSCGFSVTSFYIVLTHA